MKCLSIHQPWATAILQLGKAVENRTWPTNYRGPLLIHASKSKTSYEAQDRNDWRERYGVELPEWDSMVTGAILGVVELASCARLDDPDLSGQQRAWLYAHRFAEGPVCWVLKNARAFTEPIPCTGRQGLFEVDDAIVQAAMMPSAVA